jgi:phage regulator Rha-like protein
MKDLVVPYNGEPRASTKLIAEGFGVEHRSVIKLVQTYLSDFIEFGNIPGTSGKKSIKLDSISNAIYDGGKRQETILFLNEEQATFLGTLMRNSEKSVPFKKMLVRDYYRIRNVLAKTTEQRTDAEWIESRKDGKSNRIDETDWIQKFVDYAREQGSKSPDKYFMNISTMENSLLFIVSGKFKNLRDVMTKDQLITISIGDNIVKKALREGMEKKMFYKDIFQMAKSSVMQFAAVYDKSEIVANMFLTEHGQ